MSYDLRVFGSAIDVATLRAAIAVSGLEVESDGSEVLIVVRGARRRYSFSVGAPVLVEPEDVPAEVVAAVLGPTHLVEIGVEGSEESEIPHAVRAARRVAAAMGGAVLDPQTDEVFRRGRTRSSERVERGLVSIVDVTWYVRSQDDDPSRAAAAFVDAAERHLPEALPRRYGSYEPLQQRWADGGKDAFVSFVGAETTAVSTGGTGLVQSGTIGRARSRDPHVHSHGLTVLAEPLGDERWSRALEAMFLDFAQAVEAIYATAEVERGVEWSGRALWFGAEAEHSVYLAYKGRWHGLTPHPVWLSWFGREYAPLVRDHLPADTTVECDGGLLHKRSETPKDRDALDPAWLPPEYLAVPPEPGRWALMSTIPAAYLPATLRDAT
ncbi:hypothetical protein N1028_18740 [Herbiconiux sp. CPCC 203407]|uniref:Uncharacterized protein n=1 Tax=Herbiconiux oxytropis TaxID=2970915 RepID=A0AA42BUV0_9MICO|nr:hypothetical protein [Herbiconiux oxytropis]MCS5723413.1 hypothetical protein [Herbiconiux oxytropis]MCS5727940.1 hypothetical protein [Herbiconiux oxytropis]